MSTMALPPGASLNGGRYVVESVLGQGGFGITYRAQDTTLNRTVAIKEFFLAGSTRLAATVQPPPHLQEEFADRKERILEEARALARFRHPSIVTVHEFFEENSTVYVVMEYLRGRSLRQVLAASGGSIPAEQAVRYGAELGTALEAVHAENILHRDVKPDNIIVMEDDSVVLVDFGTAREFLVEQSSLMSQTLTPGYAPVEQYTAQGRFGPPTDIYALGATLYHAVTGEAPTPSLDRFTGAELRAPKDINSTIGQKLNDALLWAMALEAPDRPQSAAAFAAALSGGQAPSAAASPDATRLVAGGETAAAWGTRSAAPSEGVPAPNDPAPAKPKPSEAVRKARRKRTVKRGLRRVGRLATNLMIAVIIGIAATIAVTWFVNRDSEPAPATPMEQPASTQGWRGAPVLG